MSDAIHQQLIADLDAAARRVDAAIAGLDDESASRPAADGWSVKDHLTHMTFWHEMRFFETSRIARGGRSSFPVTDEEGIEAINQKIARNRRQLPLDQVIADLAYTREMVKQAVTAAADARLASSLFEEVGPVGAGHEIEHAAQIENWRKESGI